MVYAWDIGFWFCCLNPREREVLRLTAEALLLTLFVGVPTGVWDAFWFAFPNNGAAVRAAFVRIYKLEIVTIVIDEAPIEVIRPVVGFLPDWVSWGVFVVTPSADCGAGCEQSRFS